MFELRIDTREAGEAARKLMQLPGLFARARRSALRSVGWELQQELKRAGSMGVSELGWPPLHPHSGTLSLAGRRAARGQRIKTVRGRGKKRERLRHIESMRRNPMGRLVNAVRYRTDGEGTAVEIGFFREEGNLFRLARMQARGFRTPVTERMRRFFFAVGFPVSRGLTAVETPPRPWIQKVFERQKASIPRRFEERFFAALTRYREGRPRR